MVIDRGRAKRDRRCAMCGVYRYGWIYARAVESVSGMKSC